MMPQPSRPSGLPGPLRRSIRAGFTLLELLVVAGTLAILFGLILPALAGARSKVISVLCSNNHRQLGLANLMYVGDHDGAFPYNLGAAGTRATVADGTFRNWANNVMSWELDQDNTNTLWLLAGGLGHYLGSDASVFRCPSDRVVSDVQAGAGWNHRVRSISMNAMVGNAGVFSSAGVNTNNPHYRQFFTLSQMPDPSRIFVFIDEHPDSVNDGYFVNRAYSGRWNDLPASYHDGGATLSFADGHVQRHEWVHPATRPDPAPDTAGLPFMFPPEERSDFDWLMAHTSLKGPH